MDRVEKKRYHVIYKTTRPSTGEYYIGKHSTDNLDDGYQGSGQRVKAILKKEDCITEILHYCRNEEEAYKLEGEIVDLGRISDPLCLNLMVGGCGYDSGENHPLFGKTLSEEAKRKISEVTKGENNHMFGRTHSEEAKIKMREAKEGEKNPRFKGYYHTPFGVFSSSIIAAEAEKCVHTTILYRVKNKNGKFIEYWLEPLEKG